MSLRERMAAYEASLKKGAADAEAQPKVGPVDDAPPVSLKRIQSAYALSAAAVNRERMKNVVPFQRAQSSSSFIEPPATEELLDVILKRVADGEISWVDLTFHNEFTKLSQKAKSDVIYRLADAGEAIETVKLNSVGLDNSNAPALAQLVRGNRKLHGLQLEGNLLTEPGLLELAEGVHGHRALSELSLASQKVALSTATISRFIDAMEATTSLISCNLGHLRDDTARRRHQAANMANVDAMRQRRNAAREANGPASPATAGPTQRRAVSFSQRRHTPGKPPPSVSVSTALAEKQAKVAGSIAASIRDATMVADWDAEAQRIGASQMFEYGHPSVGSPHEKLDRGIAYVATGSLLWSRASQDEQLRVIRAFGTNTTITTVVMVNVVSTGAASDAVAQAWADTLRTNSTITSLNLESNGIQSDGITALAAAVASPACGLLELRLANQRLAVSQAAEETLAEAVATNRLLRTVTLDARSNRARELIVKTMNANIEEHRRAKRSGAAGPTAQAELSDGEASEPRTAADLRSTEIDPLATAAVVNPDAAMAAQLSRAKPAAARRPTTAGTRGRRRAEVPADAGEAGGQPTSRARVAPAPPTSADKGDGEGEFSRSATWSPATKKAAATPKVNIGAIAAEAGSRRLQTLTARMPTVLGSPEPSPRCSAAEAQKATTRSSAAESTAAATWHTPPSRGPKAVPTEARPTASAGATGRAEAAARPAELGAVALPSHKPPCANQPPAPQPARQLKPAVPAEPLAKPRAQHRHPAPAQPSSQPSWVKERQLRSAQPISGGVPPTSCPPEDASQPSWVKKQQLRSAPSPVPRRSQFPPEHLGERLPSWATDRQLRSVQPAPEPPTLPKRVPLEQLPPAKLDKAFSAASSSKELKLPPAEPPRTSQTQPQPTLPVDRPAPDDPVRPAPAPKPHNRQPPHDSQHSAAPRWAMERQQRSALPPGAPVCQSLSMEHTAVSSKPSSVKEQRAPPTEPAAAHHGQHQRQPSQPSWVKPNLRSVSRSAVQSSDTDSAGFSSASSEPSPVFPSGGANRRQPVASRSGAQEVARTTFAAPLAPTPAVTPTKSPPVPPAEAQPAGAISPVPDLDDLVRFDAGLAQKVDPFPSPRKAKPPPPVGRPRMKLRSFSQIFASQGAD